MKLAQFNISHCKEDLEHPIMQDFIAKLKEINSLADRTTGFIWRLKDESDNSIAIKAFKNPRIIYNLSVWESIDSLKSFVYKSKHSEILKNRNQWFENFEKRSYVLWWIPDNHIPSLTEAKSRLYYIQNEEETIHAFSFKKIYEYHHNALKQPVI